MTDLIDSWAHEVFSDRVQEEVNCQDRSQREWPRDCADKRPQLRQFIIDGNKDRPAARAQWRCQNFIPWLSGLKWEVRSVDERLLHTLTKVANELRRASARKKRRQRNIGEEVSRQGVRRQGRCRRRISKGVTTATTKRRRRWTAAPNSGIRSGESTKTARTAVDRVDRRGSSFLQRDDERRRTHGDLKQVGPDRGLVVRA